MADRAKELMRVVVDESTAATHDLVAGEAGYDIVVAAAALSAANDVKITLKDETGDLLPAQLREDGGPLVLPDSHGGWARCTAGEKLRLTLSAGVAVSGVVVYRLVPSGMEF